MKYRNRRIAPALALAIPVLLLAACGGEQTVASKSAEALREAQKKGTPIGGDHGGHTVDRAEPVASTPDSTMTGMDHSTMTGVDHSQMKLGESMAGMDHSQIKPGQSMAGMDHSQMKPGQSMAGMDHSPMKPGQPMAGMDHSQMKPGQSMAEMNHSQMKPGEPMAGVDHSNMPGMQQPSLAAAVGPPTTTAEVQRLRPAATLKGDEFDAPAPAAVAEARKASQNGGHEGMQMGGITPGQDRENPPTPAPALRDGRTQGISAPATDHSSHSTAPAAPAVDHTQHGQSAPVAPRSHTKKTTNPQAAPPAATVYTCPMHPEVTSNKPGTCPKCGMALVKKK